MVPEFRHSLRRSSPIRLHPVQALRLALAQIDPTLGDLPGNCSLVRSWSSRAAQDGAQVVLFPAMALTGAPVDDTAHRFTDASSSVLLDLAVSLDRAGCGDTVVVVGYPDNHPTGSVSSAAVLFRGEVVLRRHVRERRLGIVAVNGFRLAIAIGEELSRLDGPVAAYAELDVDAILCLDARPHDPATAGTRAATLARRARDVGVAVAHANLVGGQGDVVFDGGSTVIAAGGTLLGLSPVFTEHVLHVDLEPRHDRPVAPESYDGWELDSVVLPDLLGRGWHRTPRFIAPPVSDTEYRWSAAVTALRDHVHKNGFTSVAVGLNGDLGSAVVVALAVDAAGSGAVHGVLAPSTGVSDDEIADSAADVVRRTGIASNRPSKANNSAHLTLATGYELGVAERPLTQPGAAVFAPIGALASSTVRELARWRNDVAVERGEVPPIPEYHLDGLASDTDARTE